MTLVLGEIREVRSAREGDERGLEGFVRGGGGLKSVFSFGEECGERRERMEVELSHLCNRTQNPDGKCCLVLFDITFDFRGTTKVLLLVPNKTSPDTQ